MEEKTRQKGQEKSAQIDGSSGRQIILGKYEMGRLLGQGAYAKVYKARNLETQETVAIKVINKNIIKKQDGLIQQIKREISIMRLVKHPNIVELKEVTATRTKIFFVMEYAKGGDLLSRVEEYGKLKEDLARKYFQQLISAVDYCHSRGVCHRDLKLENLLLDEKENLKVSDFGLSALPEQLKNDGLLHTQCGTPAYVAPEVLRKKGYDGSRADLWSCGVILYVLLAGRMPFGSQNLMKMYVKIFKAEYEFPPWISKEAKDLVSKLLVVDPGKRLTIPQLVEDPWFRKGLKVQATCETCSSSNGSCNKGCDLVGKVKNPPPFFNAFEFITAMSSGFDLSGLFESRRMKSLSVFTSKCPAQVILGKLEEVAKELDFGVESNEEEYKVKLQGKEEWRKGKLSVMVEVFEVAPEVTVVELSKCSGDTLDYTKFCEEYVRPAIQDLVWCWQGDS